MRASFWGMNQRSGLALVVLGLVSCSAEPPPSIPRAEVSSDAPPPKDDPALVELDRIARAQADLKRVRSVPDRAPALCAAPPMPEDALRVSQAEDQTPHGKKLFYLKPSNLAQYPMVAAGALAAPEDFFVVKDAYEASSSGADVGAPVGLFIAYRMEGRWRFGTVTPEGRASSAGEAACASCHASQTRNGLFGPQGEGRPAAK